MDKAFGVRFFNHNEFPLKGIDQFGRDDRILQIQLNLIMKIKPQG